MEKKEIGIDTLKYIVKLINDGESAEAFKEFKRQFGIINVFKCTECGKEYNKVTNMLCSKCSNPVRVTTIIED